MGTADRHVLDAVARAGLFAGGILIVAIERTNLWRRMPFEQYVVDFRRSLYRLDPMLPILGTISGIGAVLFAPQHQRIRLP